MPDEDMQEECAGCGWAFADGGEYHEVNGQALGFTDWSGLYLVCTPCLHTSGLSKMFEAPQRMNLNQMTNLILKAIRDAAEEN